MPKVAARSLAQPYSYERGSPLEDINVDGMFWSTDLINQYNEAIKDHYESAHLDGSAKK